MTHGDDSPPPATLTDAGDCREPDNVFNDPERGVASEEPPRRRFDAFLMTGNMIIHTSSSSDSRPSNRNRQRIPRCAKNASYTSQPVSQSSPVTIDQLLAPDLHPPVSRIPVKKTSRAGQSRLPRPSGQRSNGDSHVTSTCDTNNDLGYTTPVSSKPDREIPTLTSAIPTASSGIPTPTSSVPTPSSQPCSGIPITNPSIPTTPSSIPSTTTSTAIPTISTGIPTPSSVIPTPSSGNPTPSSGIPAPTSGIPTPSSAHKNVTPKPVGAQDFIPSAGNLTTGNLSSGNLSSGNLATGIPSPLRSRRFRRSSDTPAQSKLAASRIPTPSLAHSTTAASTPASSSIKPPSSSIQPHHKDQGDNLTNTNINNNSRSGIVPPQKNQYQHHRGKRSFSFSNGSSVPPVSCPTPPAPPTSANAIPREQHRHDDGSTRLTPSSLPRSTSDPPASVAGDSQPRKYKSKTAFSSAPSESSPPSCLPQHNHSNGIHHSPVNIQNEPCLKPLVIEESIDYNPLTSTHTDRPITPVNPASPIHLPCAPLTTTNAEIQQGDDAKSSPSSMDAIEAPLTDVKLISQNSSVNTEPLDAITVYKLPDEGTSLCSLPAVDQPLPNAKPASSASEVSASPLIQPNTSPISFDPNSSITSDTTPLDINPLVQSSTEFTPITLTTTTASPSPKSPLTHVDSSPLTTSSTAVVIPTTGINMAPDEPLSATYVHTPSLPVEQPKDGVSVELTDDVITTALTTTQTATPTTVPTICPATVPTTIPTTPPTTAPTTAPAQNVEDANSAKDSGSNVICDESTTSSLNPVTSFHSQGHSTSPGHSVLRDHQKRPKSEMLVSCTERPSTLIKPLPDMPSSPLHRAQFTELSSRVPNGYDGESRLLDIPPDDICSEDEAFSRDHRHLASVDTDQLPPPPAALLADYPSAATSPLTTALPSNSKPSTSPNFTSPSTISTCSDMPFVPFTPENDSSYQPPPLLGSDGFYRRHERRLRRAYKPRTASTNTTDDEDDEEDDEESGEMDKFADRLTRLTDRRDSWQTDSDEDNDAANLNSNSPLRHLRLVQLEGDDNRQPVLPPRLNPPPGYGEGSPTPPPPSLSTSATITPHPTMPIQATVSCTRVVDSATPTHSVSTSPSKFNPDQISPSSPKGTSFSRPFEPKLRPTNPPSPLPSRNSAESPSVRTPTPPVLSITQRSVSMTDSSTMTTDLHLNLEPIRLLSKSTEDSNNTLESIKFVDSTSEEEQVAVDSQVDSQVSCSEVKENSEPEKEDQTELSVDDKQCDTEIIETPIDNAVEDMHNSLLDESNFSHIPTRSIDKPSAERLASRLYRLEGFQRSDVARHLSKRNDFSFLVGQLYLDHFDFASLTLDAAARKFLDRLTLTGETQERERILRHFSTRYLQCNRPQSTPATATVGEKAEEERGETEVNIDAKTAQKDAKHNSTKDVKGSCKDLKEDNETTINHASIFKSDDACHTLSCALLLLNSDLHSPQIARHMNLTEFIQNLDDLNEGENYPKQALRQLFLSIKKNPIQELKLSPGSAPSSTPGSGSNSGPVLQASSGQGCGTIPRGRNAFLEVPDASKAKEIKKGYMMRKCCLDQDGHHTPFGKRSWKTFYVTLKDFVMYLHKDYRKQTTCDHLANMIRVNHSLASPATDYKKKPHVFRLKTADWSEYLFQTGDSKECQDWIDSVNFVAAVYSAPALPSAIGSQTKKFQRPLLPSGYTKLSMTQQLAEHQQTADCLQTELKQHRTLAPEKGSRSRVVQAYVEKENYLQFEFHRFKIYADIVQREIARCSMLAQQQQQQQQQLAPSLVEIAIGEVDEPPASPPTSSNIYLSGDSEV